MKLKTSFTTNSSSSSFIVIGNSSKYNFNELDHFHETLVANSELGETEFGWGPYTVRGVGSMINFAYLQAKNNKKWLEMLEKVIKENTNIKEIEWKISENYNCEDGYDWGYIDHASSAVEGQNIEMFDDEENLKNFIFNSGSHIVLDNDNH